jgi:hypothetical protein
MDFKFRNITLGDSQIDLANKLNLNFSSIASLDGGLNGLAGESGDPGKTGPVGVTGPQGSQGYRGSKWFVQDSSPTSGVLIGDYLANTSLDCEVFRYQIVNGNADWVSQNFLISQYGVFGISNYQTGVTSGNPQFSYIQNLTSPATKTFTLTCATGANIKNPQLSKVVIGTGGTTGYPLLEFSKFAYQSDNDFNLVSPKIKWGSTSTTSSDSYRVDLLANDGFSINSNNFSAKGLSEVRVVAGQSSANNRGGLTGSFSGNINFTIPSATTSSALQINTDKFKASSRNIPVWDNSGLTANVSLELYSQDTSEPTLYVENGIVYTRNSSVYTASDYLLRVKYKGDPTSTNQQLLADKDHLLVSSDGNVRFPSKISPFTSPSSIVSGSSLATGTFNASFEGISGQSFYTLVPTISEAAASSTVNRWSFGDIRILEFGTGYDTSGQNALCISIPRDSVKSDGFSYLVSGLNEAISFKVYAFFGINAIILDVTNSSPSTSFNFNASSTNFSLISPGDSSIRATLIEITLIREDNSNNWKCYYSASGGNIVAAPTTGFANEGFVCGCVRL